MKKIYILHGWAYDTLKWQPFLDKLKSNGIEPIILKIPGLTDKIDKPWTVDDYVNWLDGKLDKENKVILLGHSNGGKIALTFAFKFPNKIDKLFLIDSKLFCFCNFVYCDSKTLHRRLE
jgi:pimeloyl-ACP methyl ester carboxylesterase